MSVLPGQMVEADVNGGRLQKFNVAQLTLERRFSLIYYHNKRLTRAARAFIELMDINAHPSPVSLETRRET